MPASVFGLDIGRAFIKVVKVESRGSKKMLSAASMIPTPERGIQSEAAVDLKKVSDAIKTCVSSAKIGTEKCAVSLVESQVVSRLIQLPNLTDKELSSAISWEAEQYIPLPIKDVVLQYKVVDKAVASADGNSKMNVLLIAAPKRVVSKYMTVVRDAGLKPEYLETESAALARCLTKPTDPPTIIVSMGAFSTELLIVFGGNVFFTRSIATGGVSLTKAIISEFNLPAKQAEEYKQTYGILEDKLSGKVASVLKPILDIVTGEILKAVEYAKGQIKTAQITRVVICGGGAFLPGIAEFFVERTSLEVSLGDPWSDFSKEGLVVSLAGQGSLYAVATGLAMRL